MSGLGSEKPYDSAMPDGREGSHPPGECLFCAHAMKNEPFTAEERLLGTGDRFNYDTCSNCGSVQICHSLASNDLEKYYPQNYYSFEVSESSFLKRCAEYIGDRIAVAAGRGVIDPGKFFPVNHWLKLMIDFGARPSTRILDVGCGSGELIRRLARAGFKSTTGIDPFIDQDIQTSEGAVIKKRDIYNIDGIYDLILFSHSLEHVPNPLGDLSAARALLDDDGICVVRIPTVSSYAWRTYAEYWAQLDAPRHIAIPSVQGMRELALRAGFSVERITYEGYPWSLWTSEMYRRGIGSIDADGKTVDPSSIFSSQELADWEKMAKELNQNEDGDSAAFLLKKVNCT